jgi:DNA-binding response OmpR family regulator
MIGNKILIADDDRNLVDALAVRCRMLGLVVRTAHDSRTALNIIFEERPDVACLDVNMPCGNGLCVCEMLASDPRFVSLPVIVLTGNTDQDTVRRCHNLCAYYVPKCVDIWSRIGPLLQELLPETRSGVLTP